MKIRSRPSFSKPSPAASSSSRSRSNSAPPKVDTRQTQKTEISARPNAPRPTPSELQTRTGWAPSDNMIRAEHGLPLRQDYSGMRPGNNSNTTHLSMFDEGSDNRSFFQRLRGEPSPVGGIVSDLER